MYQRVKYTHVGCKTHLSAHAAADSTPGILATVAVTLSSHRALPQITQQSAVRGAPGGNGGVDGGCGGDVGGSGDIGGGFRGLGEMGGGIGTRPGGHGGGRGDGIAHTQS